MVRKVTYKEFSGMEESSKRTYLSQLQWEIESNKRVFPEFRSFLYRVVNSDDECDGIRGRAEYALSIGFKKLRS